MKLQRPALIFALGFFALVSQTLVFRDFFRIFEGNELGVGVFFATWFLWVSLGALLGRIESGLVSTLTRNFELGVLLYVPAFLLQRELIDSARELAGVQPYEVFPAVQMLRVAFLTNAPISLLTGWFFTRACRFAEASHEIPVARVYILETLGAFVGGLYVTLLLSRGIAAETVFLSESLLLAFPAVLSSVRGDFPLLRRILSPAPFLLTAFALLAGFGNDMAGKHDRHTWRKLLPAEAYRGSFATAQARYHYGEKEGEFVVLAWGGTVETLPEKEHSAQVVALTMAQAPHAKRILVVGSFALAISEKFLKLPQVEKVTWLHPDPEFPKALLGVLPPRLQVEEDRRIEVSRIDARSFIERSEGGYDLVLINLPDATSLVLNRYTTREFFALLKQKVLTGNGVLAVRVSGGANYLGGELAYLGSSIFVSLETAFGHLALKPGDESWFLASDAKRLSESPAELRDRFASIPKSSSVFPAARILSLYQPDRIAFQKEKYRNVIASVDRPILLNTDFQPKALLYSLLLALRQAGYGSISQYLETVLSGGLWILLGGLLFFSLVRTLYLYRSPGTRIENLFNVELLIFSSGLAGMSLAVLLMFFYQLQFGSLFLHLGLLSSLFMLGSFAGSFGMERLLLKAQGEKRRLLVLSVLFQLAAVVLISKLSMPLPKMSFAFLFVLCGVVTGAVFPAVAHRFKVAGRTVAQSGATLELLDHVGAALGALLTGLLLIPLWGGKEVLEFVGVLLAVNLLLLILPRWLAQKRTVDPSRFDRCIRPVGYTVFGLCAFFLASSQMVAHLEKRNAEAKLRDLGRDLVGGVELAEKTAKLQNGSSFSYFTGEMGEGKKKFYLFSSEKLARHVYGYGGPIVLLISAEENGSLLGFRLIGSRETPAYLNMLVSWTGRLPGRNIFGPFAFKGIDSVSGATLTSQGIVSVLDQAGRAFAAQVLGKSVEQTSAPPSSQKATKEFLLLIALAVVAVVLRFHVGCWKRRLLLVAALAVGIGFNLQYSSQQVLSLLSFHLPRIQLSEVFFLVVLIPLFVVLFGNVYCGSLCPFGALQELIGDLKPRKMKTEPGKEIWRYGRALKYFLLALLLVLFAFSRDFSVLGADPLITVFSSFRSPTILWMAAVVLLLSFPYRRFWCRNLCPAGAFLSLLSAARVFKKIWPESHPVNCDLGVRSASELDCLNCDRCRLEKK